VDAEGTVRIGRTRVTLETVVGTFDQGATPEEISERFSVLRVEDVYAVIAYYLNNREAVQAYVRRQEEEGEAIRREIEAHMDSRNPRERSVTRREANAATTIASASAPQ
jgi:uncharacterized protein (DUF433 family)